MSCRTRIISLSVAVLLAVIALAALLQAASLPGAVFTTTPSGAVVNANVQYISKTEVYLDGGPGPNAPQHAAGLPDGYYVFQVTDPSGAVALSTDASKCRIVKIKDSIIVNLADWNAGGITDASYATTIDTAHNNACHKIDALDQGTAGPSTGAHDINTDRDHGGNGVIGSGAIIVQLYPFLDTPNPGGVYKAWLMPVDRYVQNGGLFGQSPSDRGCVTKQGKLGNCGPNTIGYVRDPGFGPPRDQVKTDNFKVKEFFPPTVTVHKFHDVNANHVMDSGEPEIGVNRCVLLNGGIDACSPGPGGGWPVDYTETLGDGSQITGTLYTGGAPFTVTGITVPETIQFCEQHLPGWTQTAPFDGSTVQQCVTVSIAGTSGEQHDVWFGNAIIPTVVTEVHDASHKFVDPTNPAPLGSILHDTATVSDGNANLPIPQGLVTFRFYRNLSCDGTGEGAGTVAVDANGVGHPSASFGPLPAGSYSFKARFEASDGVYASVDYPNVACEPAPVDKSTPHLITAIHLGSDHSKDAQNTEIDAWSFIHDSATMDRGFVAAISPTAPAVFTFFTARDCPVGTGYAAGGHAFDGNGLADPSDSEGPLSAGDYSFIVTFTGDDNYKAAEPAACENVKVVNRATRTPGFWGTHTAFANSVWGAGQPLCTGANITAIPLAGQNQLMGGFWAGISNLSNSSSRTALDQARMQLLQQYFAAVLNHLYFGSGSTAMLNAARTAYCGSDAGAILTWVGTLDKFNNSGDTLGDTSAAGNATSQDSQTQANIVFWDITFR
jgi:hypothetical protein